MSVTISNGNIKMGLIKSVSLPAVTTCDRRCECAKRCYALRMEKRYPSVRKSYVENLRILIENPTEYWNKVETAIKLSRFFRFHVSGDIVDPDYFSHMAEIAKRNPNTEILCFTKKYSIVNDFIANMGMYPDNLHMIFSIWENFECDNPYDVPECHIRYKDGHTTANENAIQCGGNCTECAVHDGGCWTVKSGEQILIDEH